MRWPAENARLVSESAVGAVGGGPLTVSASPPPHPASAPRTATTAAPPPVRRIVMMALGVPTLARIFVPRRIVGEALDRLAGSHDVDVWQGHLPPTPALLRERGSDAD